MEKEILSVKELSSIIQTLLENQIGYVFVQGEISNYKKHSSGHIYFTLKDDYAQVFCTLWKSRALSIELRDGMKVIVEGYLTVYPPRGQYQIECVNIVQSGIGELYLKFEELKKKLSEKGYFEQSRKRKIPVPCKKIGIITSKTGAVIQDMLTTISRRFPLVEIVFLPTNVQGVEASKEIALSIMELNKYELDVIIIARGGGSIEDLWCFNEEVVADAIFNSRIPIISGVGHETDFTIADFVADLRAPTPTAAAEFVTQITSNQYFEIIDNYIYSLQQNLERKIEQFYDKIENIINSYAMKKVRDFTKIHIQKMDELEISLNRAFKNKFNFISQKLVNTISHFNSLNPYAPLTKGYAILEKQGKKLSSKDKIKPMDEIVITREFDKSIAKIVNINSDYDNRKQKIIKSSKTQNSETLF